MIGSGPLGREVAESREVPLEIPTADRDPLTFAHGLSIKN
jgi:hypothetical protein